MMANYDWTMSVRLNFRFPKNENFPRHQLYDGKGLIEWECKFAMLDFFGKDSRN